MENWGTPARITSLLVFFFKKKDMAKDETCWVFKKKEPDPSSFNDKIQNTKISYGLLFVAKTKSVQASFFATKKLDTIYICFLKRE